MHMHTDAEGGHGVLHIYFIISTYAQRAGITNINVVPPNINTHHGGKCIDNLFRICIMHLAAMSAWLIGLTIPLFS